MKCSSRITIYKFSEHSYARSILKGLSQAIEYLYVPCEAHVTSVKSVGIRVQIVHRSSLFELS